MMKKTLVAMAVVAASGASFAQVAITGNVSYAWSGGQDASGNQSNGIGVDTATIDFGVKEDLGGGLKVEAHEGFDTFDRQTTAGGDTTLTLSTAAFALKMGSTQLGDYMQGTGNVSGTFNGFEGRMLGSKPNKDWAGIAVPLGPVTLSVTEYEAAGGIGLGVGSGGAASTTGSRNTQYQIAYSSGALNADAAYKSYDNTNLSGSTTVYQYKTIARMGANYDFGVVKVGAAFQTNSLIIAGTDNATIVSVGAPVGNLFFGAQYLNRTVSGSGGPIVGSTVAAADYNQNGYGLEADYNFSKSTKLAVNYMNWQQIPGVTGVTAYGPGLQNSNLTEIAISKSF